MEKSKKPVLYRTKVYKSHWSSFVISLVFFIICTVVGGLILGLVTDTGLRLGFGIPFVLGAAVAAILFIMYLVLLLTHRIVYVGYVDDVETIKNKIDIEHYVPAIGGKPVAVEKEDLTVNKDVKKENKKN